MVEIVGDDGQRVLVEDGQELVVREAQPALQGRGSQNS
jgi:hypothetical protein